MSKYFLQYKTLRRKLTFIRWINDGYDSEDEDTVLDEMDDVWWKLSESERAEIDNEKPRSLIRSELNRNEQKVEGMDNDIYRVPGGPVRTIKRAS